MIGNSFPQKTGLYDPAYEKDGCGVGFVVNRHGIPTHTIVEYGIGILLNLLHRGAIGGDSKTGDGAGITVQIPDAFFRRIAQESSIKLPEKGPYGVGMFFLPQDVRYRDECIERFERIASASGCEVCGWRRVPVDDSAIEGKARDEQPVVMQCFIRADIPVPEDFDRRLYIIRRTAEKTCGAQLPAGERFYIPSLSCRTICYKGLFIAPQLKGYFPDLGEKDFASALAVVHQRYSTNTFPSWSLAQPFRYLAHNGEINTIRGNINHMKSREQKLSTAIPGFEIEKILPVIDEGGSDSACLDNALELLVAGGRSIEHAMLMLIPQAWGEKYRMGPDVRGFFEYHAGIIEPWDGPATVVFTDGVKVGALLDRNGLRPARYTVTKDGLVVLASEVGVFDVKPEDVEEKGALQPGEMILVDLGKKRVLKDGEIKAGCARNKPYRRWVQENKIELHGFYSAIAPITPDTGTLLLRQKRFGYTREDLSGILGPMAVTGHEPVGSMGHDVPLAVFSEQPQLLYNYFKQLFAQITNPAIDPIREELVMSLMTFIGNPANILTETPQHARLIKLKHPILSNEDIDRIRNLNHKDFRTRLIRMAYPRHGTEADLEEALRYLRNKAEAAVSYGDNLLIVSDRDLPDHLTPIPALLAVSAIHQHLINKGLRTEAGIIVESGEPREVMHIALLLGYGATAVNPYLAFESIAAMAGNDELSEKRSVTTALENYIKALCKGLLKIMSKMGISTLRSYRGAKIFEAIGLSEAFVDSYFRGTPTRIGGIGLREICAEIESRYETTALPFSFAADLLPSGGHFRYRKDGERHLWTPESIHCLQQATRTFDMKLYRRYSALINEQAGALSTIRGMFSFRETKPIPLAEVEPAEAIIKRFVTGAMSFGSISRETHETLAIAMNRLGAASNSGEGGEDPERYGKLPNGDSRCSMIKQVASGRFGVTTEYLVNARELQIKIAQGAKPGEGGQLPGHKVNAEIARVRHSTPGVTLISPPPHHDIYSIEDIAQLIFDLKNVNPEARISVKLVSEIGVGTIAAGVAKARADMVLISGYDGGTGASPLSSIRHAGVPWELGLAETHQTLVLNNLRNRIRVQADGQMKTGRDVIIAAMLGAEEFGFATAPLVVCGCVMMRQCHKNTCPVGVATQDERLRRRFSGKPEYIVNFFHMIASEVREYLAQLGFRTLDEIIGRSDLLSANKAVDFWKSKGMDFSRIFSHPEGTLQAVRCTEKQDHGLNGILDAKIIEKARKAIEKREKVTIGLDIKNIHRTVGAMLSGIIARRYGYAGLPDDTITLRFSGPAGQSFGAFGAHGITFVLEGEANDYLGKGLSGAKIIVKPPEGSSFDPSGNIISGNVNLYGATAGEVYLNGVAGERFGIRNSGARAVVEGVGDHGCEYMTGGVVVVLGKTGVNFGAGMSGGIAYVYDEDRLFDERCNLAMVDLEIVTESGDCEELKEMIGRHAALTGSAKACHILDNWEACLPSFVKVFPMEYRRVLGKMMREDEKVQREEVVHG
ncbi:MAG: glutamate synthase large subunit [Spirochaetales bacterium]|nr:glutamate synthase large subunit [Spirochaetales bacterium]